MPPRIEASSVRLFPARLSRSLGSHGTSGITMPESAASTYMPLPPQTTGSRPLDEMSFLARVKSLR